jgi:CRISPR system Cascade subunit CasE
MKKTMFASVLNLDRKSVNILKIKDPYSVHRVVYSLFDDVRTSAQKTAGQPSGIIYADQGGTFYGRQILILSDRIPSSCVEGEYGSVDSKRIGESFLEFDTYRFKVIMNPCTRDNKTRKLIPFKTREAITEWFINKSDKNWGFTPDNRHLQVDKIEVLQFKGKNHHPITVARSALQGVLQVTNKEKFIIAFQQGVGRGRAFGCGLLQIVPQSNNLF